MRMSPPKPSGRFLSKVLGLGEGLRAEPLLLQLWGAGHGRGSGTDKQAVGLCRPATRTALISSLL